MGTCGQVVHGRWSQLSSRIRASGNLQHDSRAVQQRMGRCSQLRACKGETPILLRGCFKPVLRLPPARFRHPRTVRLPCTRQYRPNSERSLEGLVLSYKSVSDQPTVLNRHRVLALRAAPTRSQHSGISVTGGQQSPAQDMRRPRRRVRRGTSRAAAHRRVMLCLVLAALITGCQNHPTAVGAPLTERATPSVAPAPPSTAVSSTEADARSLAQVSGCAIRSLKLSLDHGFEYGDSGGDRARGLVFENDGPVTCTLQGFVNLSMMGASNLPLTYTYGGYQQDCSVSVISLQPGAAAGVIVDRYRCDGKQSTLVTAAAVTLPGQRGTLRIPYSDIVCTDRIGRAGNNIFVSPFLPVTRDFPFCLRPTVCVH